MEKTSFKILLSSFAFLIFCPISFLTAQTDAIWQGAAGGDWNTASNWDINNVPDALNERAIFDGSGGSSVNLSSAITVDSIRLRAGQTDNIVLSGATINLDAGASGSNHILWDGTSTPTMTIGNNLHLVNGGNSNSITLAMSNQLILNGVITAAANRNLRVVGSSSVILNANNSYSTQTFLERGTIILGHDNALGTSTLKTAGSTYDTTLKLDDSYTGTRTIGNSITFQDTANTNGTTSFFQGRRGSTLVMNGAIDWNNTGAGTNQVTLQHAGVGTGDFTARITATDGNFQSNANVTVNFANTVLEVAPASGTQTWNSVISGAGRVIKSGNGTTVFTQSNSYTGSTTITGGTLSIASDAGLGTAPASATSGHLTLNGGTLQATESFTLHANRRVSLGASHGTIEVASGKTVTYGGLLVGSGNLIKSGDGTLALSNVSTFTGDTIINGGTLLLQGNNRIPTTSDLTLGGGTLDANNFNQTFANFEITANSIINFGSSSSSTVTFTGNVTGLQNFTLSIYNWNGTPDAGGNLIFNGYTLNDQELANIRFFRGDNANPVWDEDLYGNVQLSGGTVAPVPEASTYLTGILLLGVIGVYSWKKNKQATESGGKPTRLL